MSDTITRTQLKERLEDYYATGTFDHNLITQAVLALLDYSLPNAPMHGPPAPTTGPDVQEVESTPDETPAAEKGL